MPATLVYKIADTSEEFEAIHRLNHRTFAQEIPQHHPDPSGRLVDRFHAENTYFVCLDDRAVVGMVAGRSQRPFSLDGKLADLDRYLPAGSTAVEIRLLAVDPGYRNGTVLARLVGMVGAHFASLGCDLAVISGTTRALRMYTRMGFVPFGPLTGVPGAQFQSMYLTAGSARFAPWSPPLTGSEPESFGGADQCSNFLPGPVSVAPEVAAALAQPPIYHRSAAFLDELAALHKRLADMVGAPFAQTLVGSGTLANEVVGAQLGLLDRPGVVLAGGEFGERLVDHAGRLRLDFTVHSRPWGEVTDTARLVESVPLGGWLWAVHCETSTGTLLDLPVLVRTCHAAGVKLAMDCISSIGTVPLDLDGVEFASAASGKALGSFPGLSIVFSRTKADPAPGRIPRYLDLGTYHASDGVAFTHSSNQVRALATAIARTDWPQRYARTAQAAAWLRAQLGRLRLDVVAPDGHEAPGVCTIALPSTVDSTAVGARMREEGFLLAYESRYLRRRNWIQIALMGQWTWPALRGLVRALSRASRI